MSQGELIPAGQAPVSIDVDQVKAQIGDQVRAFLINMLPREAFDGAIETAWRKLTEPRPQLDYRGNVDKSKPVRPSELEEMVTTAMKEQLQERVKEWAVEWRKTPDCEIAGKAMLSELVEKAAGVFIQRVAGGIVLEAAEALAGNASTVTNCGCGRVVIRNQQCGNCGEWN